MTALELLNHIGVIPMSAEKPCTHPTKSELKRWLDQKSVRINNTTPKAFDEVEFPITDLCFFPKSNKRKCTVI